MGFRISFEPKQPKKKKKKNTTGQFSKRIVIFCIFLVIGYTGFCLAMQWFKGFQPESQLTIGFFAFVTVELWNLSNIKRDKTKNPDTNNFDNLGGDDDG